MRHRSPGAEEHSFQVDLLQAIPALARCRQQRPHDLDRRAIDEDVDSSELVDSRLTAAATLTSEETSISTNSAPISSECVRPWTASTSNITTRAPRSESNRAHARPIPEAAPVTMATLSLRLQLLTRTPFDAHDNGKQQKGTAEAVPFLLVAWFAVLEVDTQREL